MVKTRPVRGPGLQKSASESDCGLNLFPLILRQIVTRQEEILGFLICDQDIKAVLR
jgi:hypothetical protein